MTPLGHWVLPEESQPSPTRVPRAHLSLISDTGQASYHPHSRIQQASPENLHAPHSRCLNEKEQEDSKLSKSLFSRNSVYMERERERNGDESKKTG